MFFRFILCCVAIISFQFFPNISKAESSKKPYHKGVVDIGYISFVYDNSVALGKNVDSLLVAYDEYSHVSSLKTPQSDVKVIGESLKYRGVESRVIRNGTKKELFGALRDFKGSKKRDLFIFYYAGHAAEINGSPSILFTNFSINGNDIGGDYSSISDIVKEIGDLGYKKVLIVFDACRTAIEVQSNDKNPIDGNDAEISLGVRGLKKVRINNSDLDDIEYAISFSASSGKEALDTVNGINSPYAEAFANNIRRKPTFLEAIIETRKDVRFSTRERQKPTLEMSWDDDKSFTAGAIKSLDIQFGAPKKAKLKKLTKDFSIVESEYGGDLSMRLSRNIDEKSGCALYRQPEDSETLWLENLDCINKEAKISDVNGEPIFKFFLRPAPEDTAVALCEKAIIKTDINGDGDEESFIFLSNQYEGYLRFTHSGSDMEFKSGLGCNMKTFSAYDLDGDGIRDIIITFYQTRAEAVVILSGAKLFQIASGEYKVHPNEPLAKFMRGNDTVGVLGGLEKVALFYDEYEEGSFVKIENGELRYETSSDTWQSAFKPAFSEISPRYIKIERNGDIKLRTQAKVYEITGFPNSDLKIVERAQ